MDTLDQIEAAYTVRDGQLTYVIGCIEGMGGKVQTLILPGSHEYWAARTVFEETGKIK